MTGAKSVNFQILQHKDGILTARVRTEERSCVVKHYEKLEFTREINNYKLLSALNVPTLRVIDATDCSILLEDIACSEHWRLGRGGDLSDPAAARAIARWYRRLHDAGRHADTSGMYDESDLFTPENIRRLPDATGTRGCEAWPMLERHYDTIRQKLDGLQKTITYNDFYWTNLAVSKDGTEALMFDYNLLGRGYAYADLRNVTASLGDEAAEAFLAEYGPFAPQEQAVDEMVSVIVTLHLVSQRQTFPNWAKPSLEILKTDLCRRIEQMICMLTPINRFG